MYCIAKHNFCIHKTCFYGGALQPNLLKKKNLVQMHCLIYCFRPKKTCFYGGTLHANLLVNKPLIQMHCLMYCLDPKKLFWMCKGTESRSQDLCKKLSLIPPLVAGVMKYQPWDMYAWNDHLLHDCAMDLQPISLWKGRAEPRCFSFAVRAAKARASCL